MKRLSIRQLAHFSGIRQPTIRMWETRYDLLHPQRSASNIRYYSVDDLEHLLYISFLTRRGRSIGYLTQLDYAEIKRNINTYTTPSDRLDTALHQLIVSFYRTDVEQFDNLLANCIFEFGATTAIDSLIVPFLTVTDILSYHDSSLEVHLVVTAIRRKLLASIDQAASLRSRSEKAVLFLPEGEHYDLVLLYLQFVLKCQGFTTYYLGTNISRSNIERVVRAKHPDFLYVYTRYEKKYDYRNIQRLLDLEFPDSRLVVASADHVGPDLHNGRVIFTHFSSLYMR